MTTSTDIAKRLKMMKLDAIEKAKELEEAMVAELKKENDDRRAKIKKERDDEKKAKDKEKEEKLEEKRKKVNNARQKRLQKLHDSEMMEWARTIYPDKNVARDKEIFEEECKKLSEKREISRNILEMTNDLTSIPCHILEEVRGKKEGKKNEDAKWKKDWNRAAKLYGNIILK